MESCHLQIFVKVSTRLVFDWLLQKTRLIGQAATIRAMAKAQQSKDIAMSTLQEELDHKTRGMNHACARLRRKPKTYVNGQLTVALEMSKKREAVLAERLEQLERQVEVAESCSKLC